MKYVVNRCTLEKQKENLIKMFFQYDINNDKNLDKDELWNGLKSSGILLSNKEFNELFDKIDVNKNGKLSYEEYLEATTDSKTLNNEEMLTIGFNYLIKGETKTVEKDILKKTMSKGWMGEVGLWDLFSKECTSSENTVSF